MACANFLVLCAIDGCRNRFGRNDRSHNDQGRVRHEPCVGQAHLAVVKLVRWKLPEKRRTLYCNVLTRVRLADCLEHVGDACARIKGRTKFAAARQTHFKRRRRAPRRGRRGCGTRCHRFDTVLAGWRAGRRAGKAALLVCLDFEPDKLRGATVVRALALGNARRFVHNALVLAFKLLFTVGEARKATPHRFVNRMLGRRRCWRRLERRVPVDSDRRLFGRTWHFGW